MGKINFGRVILGGLVAGLVLNIGEILLNDFIVGSQMKSFLAVHNFAEPGGKFIAVAVGLTFVMGIVLVLGYACIRKHFGPGPNTALIAGLFAWFSVFFYSGIVNGVLFGVSVNLIGLALVWGIVEYSLAALAGAALYKES